MALSGSSLAQEIANAMGQTLTPQLTCFGNGIVNELKQGVAGVGIPVGNLITGLQGSRAATEIGNCIASQVPTKLITYMTAMMVYIMTDGTVTYSGPPPPATNIWTIGGKIVGLDGDDMAQFIYEEAFITEAPACPDQLKDKCNAVCDYILLNAEVENGVIS